MLQFYDYNGIYPNLFEREFVTSIFDDLMIDDNYYRILQIIYNTKYHNNVQTLDIDSLYNKYLSGNLTIIGSIHFNTHSSGIITDSFGNKMYCQDFYIKIIDECGNYFHLLTSPPLILYNIEIFVSINQIVPFVICPEYGKFIL